MHTIAQEWASVCVNPQMVDMTEDRKNALLHIHNKHRNEIALGTVLNYNSAANMLSVSWDNELEKLCQLNVKQCSMTHDRCR